MSYKTLWYYRRLIITIISAPQLQIRNTSRAWQSKGIALINKRRCYLSDFSVPFHLSPGPVQTARLIRVCRTAWTRSRPTRLFPTETPPTLRDAALHYRTVQQRNVRFRLREFSTRWACVSSLRFTCKTRPSLDRKDGNITRTAIGGRAFDKGDDWESLQLNATNEIMNVNSVKTMTEGMLP